MAKALPSLQKPVGGSLLAKADLYAMRLRWMYDRFASKLPPTRSRTGLLPIVPTLSVGTINNGAYLAVNAE